MKDGIAQDTVMALPPVRADWVAGVDVGGTKVHILDNSGRGGANGQLHRYETPDYPSMDAVLRDYFTTVGVVPGRIAVGMAGPRDDATGKIEMTNSHWPAFDPREASARYGIRITTANDMVATIAGVLHSGGVKLLPLVEGEASATGTRLVVTVSTGIGAAAAVWDERDGRFVVVPGQTGHIGFQPKTTHEQRYLAFLLGKYPHASVELALSGKHGLDNLIDCFVQDFPAAQKLADSLGQARRQERPVGAVLFAYANDSTGPDQQAAHEMMEIMGGLLGAALRDFAVAFKASGGIYLTGSVALALAEYLVTRTSLRSRFVCEGAVNDDWLAHTPIQLITDPNVAVLGALELARQG